MREVHPYVPYAKAVFVSSELKKTFGIFTYAHKVESANLIGVVMIAYTNTILFLA